MAMSPFSIAGGKQEQFLRCGTQMTWSRHRRLIPTGGTQVKFGKPAMIWSRTSQTRTRLIPMDVDWKQDTAADDSEQDTADSAVVTSWSRTQPT